MNAHPVVMETEAENTNLKTKLRLLPPTGINFVHYISLPDFAFSLKTSKLNSFLFI